MMTDVQAFFVLLGVMSVSGCSLIGFFLWLSLRGEKDEA